MQLENFVGAVGGRPRLAYFFIGTCGQNQLMYLDPHFVRSYSYNLDQDYIEKPEKFHCDHVRTLHLNELDPTISFGFLIDSVDSLKCFTQSIT